MNDTIEFHLRTREYSSFPENPTQTDIEDAKIGDYWGVSYPRATFILRRIEDLECAAEMDETERRMIKNVLIEHGLAIRPGEKE